MEREELKQMLEALLESDEPTPKRKEVPQRPQPSEEQWSRNETLMAILAGELIIFGMLYFSRVTSSPPC
jgi:hypothetical protein